MCRYRRCERNVSRFWGLKLKLNVLKGKEINRGKFDKLFELIVENEGNDTIVDCGASTFVPLWHYMTGNKVPELLAGIGRELVIHTVVTGGTGAGRDGCRVFTTCRAVPQASTNRSLVKPLLRTR